MTAADLRKAIDNVLSEQRMRHQMEDGKRAGLHEGVNQGVNQDANHGRNRGARHGADLVRACLSAPQGTALQNTLMRMPDKVCAAGLALLPPEERRAAYAVLAPAKTCRIEEEIRLEGRRQTSALVRGRLLRMFLSYFGKAHASEATIWIRPRRTS